MQSSQQTSSTPHSTSVLNNANNTHIDRSVFTTNNSNTYNVSLAASFLEPLHKAVAPNAILNSGGRADEVRCHLGTREEIIGLVKKSIAQKHNGPQILWLSGPAGAGKSAIMQTVAESCQKRGVPHANFFFFRGDQSRRDANAFVATIMHQIIKLYPSMGPTVAAALQSDPLLFRMGIQQQFEVLLHQALSSMHHVPSFLPPLALLIDGLDECDSENKTGQRQLLQALDTLLTQKGLYFRVVVASRVEPQISMAFSQLRSQVDTIFLDEKYSPEKDIHLFVTAEFDRIKCSHPLAFTLGPQWPSEPDVSSIVSKSSGQFIFAATVMRFIACSPASPILSLQKVKGIVPPTKNAPFAQLDAVYAYILDQVDDPEAVKVLLAIQLIMPNKNTTIIQSAMAVYDPRLSIQVFNSCLLELAPLIKWRGVELGFFHASFPDFLHDQTRSRVHHVDLERFCTGAVPIWWRHKSAALSIAATMALTELKQPTAELTSALVECHPQVRPTTELTADLMECHSHVQQSLGDWDVLTFVQELYKIYAPYDIAVLIKILRIWTSANPKLATLFPPHLRFATYQMNPRTSPSISQAPLYRTEVRHGLHPFNRPIIPSPLPSSQMHLSTSHPQGSNSQTHLSTRKMLQHMPETRLSIPGMRSHPYTLQPRPSTSRIHPYPHQILRPSTQKQLSTAQTCPFTSLYDGQMPPPSQTSSSSTCQNITVADFDPRVRSRVGRTTTLNAELGKGQQELEGAAGEKNTEMVKQRERVDCFYGKRAGGFGDRDGVGERREMKEKGYEQPVNP